ncbi:MAG: CarD family transcriptional regulator [Anaerolineales bacterium]|nr:CarD family transcriptional regulator [Anaerolineales bacterium]
MATREQQVFKEGDWIKHPYHGVGQITGLEEKTLGGEAQTFYRVDTDDSTFWIPIEEADESAARPVVSEESLEESLKILAEAPETMADHYRTRRSRIREVRESGRLTRVAELLRDLAGRRRRKSLNSTERRAYREFRQSLIAEWSRVEGIPEEKAESRLRKFLRMGRKRETGEGKAALDPLGKKK